MATVSPLVFAPSLDSLGIVDLGAGYRHACALFSSGSIACWGRNTEGELGTEVASTPHIGDAAGEMTSIVPIAFKASLATLRAIQVGAGADYSCGNLHFC